MGHATLCPSRLHRFAPARRAACRASTAYKIQRAAELVAKNERKLVRRDVSCFRKKTRRNFEPLARVYMNALIPVIFSPITSL